MKKISVIVPIYNVEKYLRKCLLSLTAQTLKELEIILINDGSTDSSREIAAEFARKYDNITLYDKQNGGLSDARNYGLTYVTGEYVAFIDSDDFVEPTMFERLYNLSNHGQKKIVEANFVWEFPHKKRMDIGPQINSIKEYLVHGRVVAWNKIYKTNWLKEIGVLFPVGRLYEDQEFFFKIVSHLKNVDEIGFDAKVEVHYVQRKTSISYSESTKVADIFSIYENIIEYYQKRNLYDEYFEEIEYRTVRNLLCNVLIRKVLVQRKRQLRILLLNRIKTFINGHFKHWKKNSYLKNKGFVNIYLKIMNPMMYKIMYLIKL